MKRLSVVLLAGAALLLITAGTLVIFRESLANWWLERRLAASLSKSLDATVLLDGVHWNSTDGLRVDAARASGPGLAVESAALHGVHVNAGWKTLLDPIASTLHVKVHEALLEGRDTGHPPTPRSQRPASPTPEMDMMVDRFSFHAGGEPARSLDGVSLRAQHSGDIWSFAGQGGTVTVTGFPPFSLSRFSATHREGAWEVHSFALENDRGGALAGSAQQDGGTWTGEFSWQDLDSTSLLPAPLAIVFRGKLSGDAKLDKGVLEGRMKVEGAEFTSAALFAKLAGALMQENLEKVPWSTFRFEFRRSHDGRIEFSNLVAVSPKGLALRGGGHYAPDSLSVKLDLGVRREGRPWLAALRPVLFTHENDGYLWTKVDVGGTPEKPTEDLTARIASAVTALPVTGSIEAASEVPSTAVEAVGGLIDSLLGR